SLPHVPSNWPIHSASGHTQNRSNACGVSPFGHPGINARLSTPPGLSQIPTSFIGSYCQGIHRAPFKTYPTNHNGRSYKPQIEQIQHPHPTDARCCHTDTNNHKPSHQTPKGRCKELLYKDARVHYTVTTTTPHQHQPTESQLRGQRQQETMFYTRTPPHTM